MNFKEIDKDTLTNMYCSIIETIVDNDLIEHFRRNAGIKDMRIFEELYKTLDNEQLMFQFLKNLTTGIFLDESGKFLMEPDDYQTFFEDNGKSAVGFYLSMFDIHIEDLFDDVDND